MFRILSLILSVIVVVGSIIIGLGYTSLPTHQEEIQFEVPYSASLVWQELVNIKEIPQRKSDVESIEIVEEFGKLIAWQENLNSGGYRIYRMNKRDEPKTLVLELTESSYGLTGIWTFELDSKSNSTLVSISEDSTLTDIKRRGYRRIMGRNTDLLIWQKYIKAGLWQILLKTP